MFFRLIDKFFIQIKYFISLLIVVFTLMSAWLFIFWILYLAKISVWSNIDTFTWNIINFFAYFFKGTDFFAQISDLLPVLASGIFIVFTYLANCLMLFLEKNHELFNKSVNVYKQSIEKKINRELHNAFIDDLKRLSLFLVKIKVNVKNTATYLTTTNSDLDTDAHANKILKEIYKQITSENIVRKDYANDEITLVVSDLKNTREFLSTLVAVSSKTISLNMLEKMDICFYCGVELLNDLSEFDDKNEIVHRLLGLKFTNKILVSPKFKLAIESLYPEYFLFNVIGEYNLTGEPSNLKNSSVYALQRKF